MTLSGAHRIACDVVHSTLLSHWLLLVTMPQPPAVVLVLHRPADHLLYNAGTAGANFMRSAQASCLESQLPNVTVDLLVAEFIPHKNASTEDFSDG